MGSCRFPKYLAIDPIGASSRRNPAAEVAVVSGWSGHFPTVSLVPQSRFWDHANYCTAARDLAALLRGVVHGPGFPDALEFSDRVSV